ncbi:bacterio-opsin activator domain-containing protein [Natrarchaeobius chitinivorans]|uniref:PAS domain S-box protein n=1 Tax=Natrarchaeobius chitinivorans TaxID=1679083 RepID=A0A3N6P3X8_NATCH|nr:bacterio-opsin activator domain-containing protein [Natrarchaeobius chitinivorans]RQG92529.1 PAS domain S-box protein [Natrarchaeobius chitinivorans]
MGFEDAEEDSISSRWYEALLDAAETYREALVVRLCGEVGLRPAELVRLSIDDLEQVRLDPPRYLIRVPGADDERAESRDRTAYLPTDVERELRRYARSNDLSADDRIFAVTPRRLQMLVSAVGDRSSERYDDPALADVSTADLRRYFARRALVDHDVNPRAVKAAGGWGSFDALEFFLPEPTDGEIVDAFDALEGTSRTDRNRASPGDIDPVRDDGVVRLLLAASDRYALVRLDADGYVDRWNRSAAALFGYRTGEIVGTHVSAFYTDDDVADGVPERTLSTALEEAGHEVDGWRVHEDGSRFRATEVISPLRDDRGRHRGYAVFVRDVSAHQEALESVRTRRDELARRDAVSRRHRAVSRSLLESTDHEAIETNACAALVDGEVYAFAWIDRTTLSDSRREWRTTSGVTPDAVDALVSNRRGTDGTGAQSPKTSLSAPGTDALGDSAPRSDDLGDDSTTCDESGVAVLRDVTATIDGDSFDGSVATVPVEHGETVYGTLSVGSARADAFDGEERRWLETTARAIGAAIAAARRRTLLSSDRVVELEISCRDTGSFFVDASRSLSCRFELDSLVPVSESSQLYYIRLEGASPAAVFDLAEAEPGIDDCRVIETDERGSRLEVVVDGSSPTLVLTEYGATVREATFEDGRATITAECGANADLRTIVDGLRAVFPESNLVGKRETDRSARTTPEFREGLEDRLTDRQESALRAAYFGGYYDWPRESTAEEVADVMGITSPTLHNHLRKAQHELLRTFFDDSSADDRRR